MVIDRTQPLPKVRQVEIIPVGEQNKLLFMLRDPARISNKVLSISAEAFFIVSHLDGRNTYTDVQVAFMRQFGQMLMSEDVEALLSKLDDCLFLENERFQNAVRAIENEFTRSPVRQPTSAGLSYPADPDELRKTLDAILAMEDSPTFEGEPVGLIAPHIDLERGKSGYSIAYQAISGLDARTFIILGTNHHGGGEVFALTRKDFLTPLGTARTDKEAVERIASELGESAFRNEIDHRTEHSVELQVLFLQHLFDPDVKIVPILTSPPQSPESEIASDPMSDEGYKKLVGSLTNLISKKRKDEFFIIAGADLAHIGPQFGSIQPLDEAQLALSRSKDQRMLDALSSSDPCAFFKYVASEQNSRNVCGLAPIDILSRTLPDSQRVLLHYEQWYDNNGMASVSYASVIFVD